MAVPHRSIGSDPHPADPTDDAAPFDLDPPPALRPLERPTVRDRFEDLGARAASEPGRLIVPIAVALVGLLIAWWLLRPPASPPIEELLPRADGTSGAASPAGSEADGAAGTSTVAETTPVEVVAQAAGAVASPGVYRLPTGSRVDDLIRAAGGLAPEADGDRVNLAAPIGDGQRIWVPRVGEEEIPDLVASEGGSPSTPSPGAPGGGTETTSELVDLNAADATQLEALPGVGPATATAIIAHREQHGPFATVDDLLEVRGIGEAKLEQIRPLATVG